MQAGKTPQDLKSTGKLPHLPYSMLSYELNLKVFLLERLSVLITFARKQLEELSSFSHQSLYRLFQPGVEKKKKIIISNQRNMVSYSQLHFYFLPPGHTQVCLRAHGTINNHGGYNYKPLYYMSMNCCLPTDHLWTPRMEGPKELICCTGKNSKHLPMSVTTICSLSVHSGTSRINTVYRVITTKAVSG